MTALPSLVSRSRLGGWRTIAAITVAGMVILLALAMERWSYDVWAAFWLGPVLLALTVPFARQLAREADDPHVGRLVLLAFGVKVILGTSLRYLMVHGIYGSGDSVRYSEAGRALAPLFRAGDYQGLGKITGTRFTEILTGQVFAGIGPTDLGGFLVFSWMAFIGLVLMVRAFRCAFPDGDQARYRLLVFFFPTLVFWPSSIGKDAWMVLCLGAAAFGMARLLTGRLSGAVYGGLGLWGAMVVRPHVALMLALAGGAALALRNLMPRLADVRPRRAQTALAAVLLVVGVVIVMGRVEAFFNLDSLNAESATGVFTDVTERTGQGGSEFDAPSANTPVGYVMAVVTVLFRPFVFEVGGVTALLTAGEGMLLAVIAARSLKRLRRLPSLVRRHPYVLLALVYVLAFAYAFSSIENFGILARQRAQLLPFLFILLALPSRPQEWPKDPPVDRGGQVHAGHR